MPSYQSSHTGAQHDDYVTKTELVNLIYPIGAIYISTNSADPSLLFGGSWTRIKDTFLLAAGSTYTAGAIGGNVNHTHTLEHTHTYEHTHTTPDTTTGSHTLTITEMPAHKHAVANYTGSGNKTGYVVLNGGAHGDRNYWNFDAVQGYSNNVGGDGGHTHSQVATTTNSQSISVTSAASNSTTSSGSNLPPYLAVYIWKRVA